MCIPSNEIDEGNCESSRSEVACTEKSDEFSVLDIAQVHAIFVDVNKKYRSLDPMPIRVMVRCSDLL